MISEIFCLAPRTDAPLPETVTKPTIGTDYLVASDEDLERPYRVIIENDDLTPMEVVVMVLELIFELPSARAFEIMFEAHHKGRALVVILPYQEARDRVYAAHSVARELGYPLSFYLEPDLP